ncbi:MAG TPA: hypothetical protein VLX85_01665 [Stellaceae bacterium]|nr:hypothetical protein [Stellaceae bacterium]
MAIRPLPWAIDADISRRMSMIANYLPSAQADLDALYADPSRIEAFSTRRATAMSSMSKRRGMASISC